MATRPPDATDAPASMMRLQWLAAALVVLAAFAFALIRVQPINLPWHLATARLAQETGHFPARNTFSYTFPDHPVFQQYPAFQGALWALLGVGGWPALSVLAGVGWTIVVLLFVRWAGPWREGAALHVIWMLGVCALWRRMMLRPDLFSMLALGALLVSLDAFARTRRAVFALVGAPLAHLFWVNSHQLWPLSLVVQGSFVAHVVALRAGWFTKLDQLDGEQPPPLWPALGALGLSIALTFATPLGAEIWLAPARTAKSLAIFRAEVAEFRRVWTMPLEFGLTLATGVPAAWAFLRARRRAAPFDLLLWLLSLALVVSAVRGLMFFGVVSVAVFQRTRARCRAAGIALAPGVGPEAQRALGAIGLAFTLLVAGNVVYRRWVHPPLGLAGTQPGLGRSIGGWGEHMTAYLRAAPPPGHMMNMGPGVGDLVILDAPGIPVFVDSRLETYPVDFLRDVIASDRDDALLDELVARWDVRWIVAEHFRDTVRARVLHLMTRGWAPTYVDSDFIVLVRPTPETATYIADHRIDPRAHDPVDLVGLDRGFPSLRAQQRARYAHLLRALGDGARADAQREAAIAEAGAEGAAAFEAP
ncbi:MAG TPA: hypothetical protein VHJ20_17230 [Polyangia bacterium]|nr:hypothetical protein [Polyangia bacterium]